MRKVTFIMASAMIGAVTLSGCIDDKYDLSDIDSTVRVDVNDLVVPINLDQITLESILDLDEDSKIKIENGEYVVSDNGSFESDEISVDKVVVAAPKINPTSITLWLPGGEITGTVELPFSAPAESFSSSSENKNSSIVSVERAGARFELSVKISVPELSGRINGFTVRDLEISLPAGLKPSADDPNKYDPATGIYTVGRLVATGSTAEVKIKVEEIDNTVSGCITVDPQNIMVNGSVGINSGVLVMGRDNIVSGASLPSNFDIKCNYLMSDIDIDTFTGRIRYVIDGVDIPDIDLTDLPDVLAQEGTRIVIDNPQIYLDMTNPCSVYGLEASTGVAITPMFENGAGNVLSTDSPFIIPAVPASKFCLSPRPTAKPVAGFEDAIHVPYTTLSYVLDGDGIPKRLSVALESPQVPEQHVSDFRLGEPVGKVEGNYVLHAPLAFGAGSQICYKDTVDGWDSEDMRHITINTLVVRAKISSQLPVGLVMSGYPIDVDGNQINGVTIDGAHVEAGAVDQEIEIHISGTITNLDGIIFNAVANANDSGTPLSPDMNIDVTHLRATVSGYYEKEL